MPKLDTQVLARLWRNTLNKSLVNAEKLARNLIVQMLGFRSTADYPAPSYLPNGNARDDLAAVLAGTKPAAIIPTLFETVEDPVFQAMLKIAADQNVHVEEFDEDRLLVGDRRTVEKLKEVFKNRSSNKEERIQRSTDMGILLGYSQEAIDEFVEYGIRRGMTFREREFRRKLQKVQQ